MKNISDILAYYLSEYDMMAFEELGYRTRTEGFNKLGDLIDKKPNYLKRLRDEYDVVTSSTRNGQKNREPRQRITEVAKYMSGFSYEEITSMVKVMLGKDTDIIPDKPISEYDTSVLDEETIEKIISVKDRTATIKVVDGKKSVRVYNTAIISGLKKLYNGKCQICGCNPSDVSDTDICEVHHIEYFSE